MKLIKNLIIRLQHCAMSSYSVIYSSYNRLKNDRFTNGNEWIGRRGALRRRRREERVGIPILDKNNFRLQSNFKTDTLLMPTAWVGVGAARKVSPNWSKETMTCHSSNCCLILFGVREKHHWPQLAFLQRFTEGHNGQSICIMGIARWKMGIARGGSAPRSNPLTFYIPFFTKKVPLLYTFYWQMVPLSHTLFRILHSL